MTKADQEASRSAITFVLQGFSNGEYHMDAFFRVPFLLPVLAITPTMKQILPQS